MYAKLIDSKHIEPFTGKIVNGNTIIYTDGRDITLLNKYAFYNVIDIKPEPSSEDKQVVFSYYDFYDNEIHVIYEEIAVKPEPSEFDKLEAQVFYTAMMTDTLIEENE